MKPEVIGKVQCVFDRGSFEAINHEDRERYAGIHRTSFDILSFEWQRFVRAFFSCRIHVYYCRAQISIRVDRKRI